MKAVTYTEYGPPDVLQIKEIKTPVPKYNEVLIRIHAAVVSATDVIFRKGRPLNSRLAIGLIKPKYPVPGDAFAGEIEVVGKDVKLFRKGDQVYGTTGTNFGAHAEYKCLPENGALALIPANCNFEESVAVCDGGLTALPFLRDTANIKKGQKVLINGASGSIGSSALQLARHFGVEVTTVCSSANVELAKSLGGDVVIDYTKEDFTSTGQTYDIIFDTVGKSSFSLCKKALKPEGIYLTTVLSLSILFQMLTTMRSRGKKAVISFTGLRPESAKSKDLVFLKELIETGKIKPVIDRRFTLEQISAAHSYVEKGHKKGSVVI